ncbi:MAG: outer membrane lipoprotein chaperone LolA [Gammaproteobacteria bacterium]|nr:outer membrane lipoprotein chaperone LolA [Gammaproteobacteria bacterium]MDH4313395.1 outer membrane lipoprotein chaperone LolA [Gammaproteobacteria bacterium]MDH5214227.1 outer membrane lipoprotein chaperone LolA [Gammaproteobacteria bacterium]
MIRKALIRALLVVAGTFACSGVLAADKDGKSLLDHFLSDVKTLSARFEQSLVDDNDIVVEESAGTFEISRPGRFRWAYTEPYEQLLIADGLNVWSYDADLLQVTVKPQHEILQSTPALLFGGSADALADFEYVGSFSDRGTVWVRLRPRDEQSGFSRVDLGFTDDQLSRMIFTDNLEQTTLVALFDVVVNSEIAADRFRFSLPAGVDLVGVPLVSENAD